MLNKNGERELCYVVKVDDIQPIQGRDKVECAVIGGWTCMVRKGQFNKNDYGYYDPICCEGQNKRIREGYVYYKTTDPTFSFKNVSREYLGKK